MMAHPSPLTQTLTLKVISKEYLQSLRIHSDSIVTHNPTYEQLRKEELKANLNPLEKASLTNTGAVAVDTGAFTGRSPKDKYIVSDDATRDKVWWNSEGENDNKPISPQTWDKLYNITVSQLSKKHLFIIDMFCGASASSRIAVRFVVEVAWQAHFIKNMFITPTEEELNNFKPEFTLLNASKTINKDWKEMGLNSPVFIAFNLSKKIQIIGGTWYGGEMKKGLFSVMNYLLPQKGIASMHCSANQSATKKDVAIFFGLSGTGKTTLSTDPKRLLIGDDEHGWDDRGIFNLEGGCYAKTAGLNPDDEPDIFNAIRDNALLENVAVDKDGKVNYNDTSKTPNTRVSYPIQHIKNRVTPASIGGHAHKIIFLSADAYGVYPPVAKLSLTQMQYHFLSGFTSKVAGTEIGVTSPEPFFSACFGGAFLLLHPITYAKILAQRAEENKAEVFLVNTGWNGIGKRISIKHTRKIIDAILENEINNSAFFNLPVFNFLVPHSIPGIPKEALDPRSSYSSQKDWLSRATKLGELFVDNFSQYKDHDQYNTLVKSGPTPTLS